MEENYREHPTNSDMMLCWEEKKMSNKQVGETCRKKVRAGKIGDKQN